MTIKIEQEAILRVLNTARPAPPCQTNDEEPRKSPSNGAPADSLTLPPLAGLPPCSVGETATDCIVQVPDATIDKYSDDFYPDLLSLESDEDDCITVSSCSTSSLCGAKGHDRRVRFAAPLVTQVKTRPRTPEEDKALLFYSEKETSRFRQEYRQEKKLISEDESDVQNVNLSYSSNENLPSTEYSSRHRISRVVVEHNDSLETFYDFNEFTYSLHNGGASSNDAFFDNDSFWSGSITWY